MSNIWGHRKVLHTVGSRLFSQLLCVMPAHTGKFRCCNYKRLREFYVHPTVTSKIGGVITNCVLAWVHVIFLSDSWNSRATDNVKLMQCLNCVVVV